MFFGSLRPFSLLNIYLKRSPPAFFRKKKQTKEHQQVDPPCFFDRPDVEEPRQGGRQQRTRLRRSWCQRPRQNRRGTADPAGKATAATDPAGKTRSGQRDGESSQEGRSNGDQAGKAAAATDPAKAMNKVGGGVGPAGQGPAPDLVGNG
jgi:hypothetical protein